MKVLIQHWRYEDGWRDIPSILVKPGEPDTEYDEDHVGWFCHAYTDNDSELDEWLSANMSGFYETTWRFNSGSPYLSVFIAEDQDANIFKLRWV